MLSNLWDILFKSRLSNNHPFYFDFVKSADSPYLMTFKLTNAISAVTSLPRTVFLLFSPFLLGLNPIPRFATSPI